MWGWEQVGKGTLSVGRGDTGRNLLSHYRVIGAGL